MKKIFVMLLILTMACTVLVGCGAKGDDKVVVYTTHGEELMIDLAEKFETETGIKVEFLNAGGGELVDRIRAEKENPQADVLYGNPTSVFIELKNEELLSPYNATWSKDLADLYRDPDNYFFGTMQTPVVMFYNKDMISAEEAPKDWFELNNGQPLMFRSTTSAASRATFSSIIESMEKTQGIDAAWSFLQEVDQNVEKYVYDSSLMFQGIAREEAAVGFWTLSGIMQNIEENQLPLEPIIPESGAVVIPDAVAVLNNAQNKNAAEKFVEYVGSPEIQSYIAQNYNRIPTLEASMKDAPAYMEELSITPMETNWETLSQNQTQWIQYLNDNVMDSAKIEEKPNN